MFISRCALQQIPNVVNLCDYLVMFYRHFNVVYDIFYGHELHVLTLSAGLF